MQLSFKHQEICLFSSAILTSRNSQPKEVSHGKKIEVIIIAIKSVRSCKKKKSRTTKA